MRFLIVLALILSLAATARADSTLDILQPAGSSSLQMGQSDQTAQAPTDQNPQQAANQTQALSFDPSLSPGSSMPVATPKPWWPWLAGLGGVGLAYLLWRFLEP